MPKQKYSIFVGRFQPFHKAHQCVIEEALKRSDHVIVVIGSAGATLNLRNPWTYEERKQMIVKTLEQRYPNRITIIPLRDFMYNDAIWMASLQQEVNKIVPSGSSIELIGHYKDSTSAYLNLFPQWKLKTVSNYSGVSGSTIREFYFSEVSNCGGTVSIQTAKILEDFKKTARYSDLVAEMTYIKNYKKSWETAPFPPTFVTVDAVVMQAGHILVVKRGINPGKGKYALPGGFLGQTERLLDAAIRELKEETLITVPRRVLEGSLKEVHTFDSPTRSARGRTITHAHFFNLDMAGPLPVVKGSDDAADALWLSISDVVSNEEMFHEDHVAIIQHFIYKGY